MVIFIRVLKINFLGEHMKVNFVILAKNLNQNVIVIIRKLKNLQVQVVQVVIPHHYLQNQMVK